MALCSRRAARCLRITDRVPHRCAGWHFCAGLHIRPTNARADDQIRRNHSTQYSATRPRLTARPSRLSQYESYADVVSEWTHLRVEVRLRSHASCQRHAARPHARLGRKFAAHGTVGPSWTTAPTATSAICRFIHADLWLCRLSRAVVGGRGLETRWHLAPPARYGHPRPQEQQARAVHFPRREQTCSARRTRAPTHRTVADGR